MAAVIQSEPDQKQQVSFGKQAELNLQRYAALPERDLFYYLINSDEFPCVLPQAQQVVLQTFERVQNYLRNPEVSQHLQTFNYTPYAFIERMDVLHAHQLALLPPVLDTPLSNQQLHYVLKQYAPTALIDGCWLQNISLAATNHTDITTRLFRIYINKIGDGDTCKHYGNLYRALLNSARISLPDVTGRLFTTQGDLSNHAFINPVFQLALSLFPRVYLPELIGFTLGHFFAAQDRLLILLMPELKQQGLDDRYCQRYSLSKQPSLEARLIQDVVTLYLDGFQDNNEKQQQWQRIWQGLVAHKLITETWQQDLMDAIKQPRILTAQQKMMALVQAKAIPARNMHRNRKLGGSLINDWFAQDPFDAEGFLQVLAASPYVNKQEPEKSTLLARSISFGGPMFRIFTDEEQQVIAEWIQSLASLEANQKQSEAGQVAPVVKPASSPLPQSSENHVDLASYAKCNKRQLYYYFVNADLYPDVLPTAKQLAQQYFRRAKTEMNKWHLPKQLRWFPYSHQLFEQRIYQIYEMETSAYETFVPPSTVPREIMVWFIQQYAPFPMVDGSWVQHIAKAGLSQTEVSARLFRIYSDEVGNAETLFNHPNVYRKMLEGEGIYMPPTDTLEFAMQPNIRDFAFDLPLLTLSASMFPKAFLPEIIGINLAIELSGLGKGYMQIIDELRYWKIDPYFFTLHLTIDNIASGHTAVAMETVHLYLDHILAIQGGQIMQQEWERIWIGYLAFRQNMTRFDATLERQATFRFLQPLIRLMMKRRKEKNSMRLASAVKID